jgi:hypothetical protein
MRCVPLRINLDEIDHQSLCGSVEKQVLPQALSAAVPSRVNIPNIVVLDTGTQRFDIYQVNSV